MLSRIIRLFTAIVVIIVQLMQPITASAQSKAQEIDSTMIVSQWERLFGMLTLTIPTVTAGNPHGSFGGVYTLSNRSVPGLTTDKAQALVSLKNLLEERKIFSKNHLAFLFTPGDHVMYEGTPKKIGEPFALPITDPAGTWIETAGVFYRPDLNDFLIRPQSSYIGRGQHPRSRDDFNNPVPGGALYIQADWEQMYEMARSAEMHVTAMVDERYSPNKNNNMYLAGQLFTAKIQNVTHIDVIDTIEIGAHLNLGYLPWDALVYGKVVHGVPAAGVCGAVAPALNPVFRVLIATGTGFTFDGIGHDIGHRYNPTGIGDLWAQRTPNGRYYPVDSTVMSPWRNFIIDTERPVSMKVTTLIYTPGKWTRMVYVTEAWVN